MPNYDQILPVRAVKQRLPDLLDQMDGPVAITQNGYAVGVLMSANEHEKLLEIAQYLSDGSRIEPLSYSKQK